MTVLDAETTELAWTGMLRREHGHLNRWHCGGRLANPTIEFATLADDRAGEFTERGGRPVIRLDRRTVDGVAFLGDAYAGKLATARLLDTFRHEVAHQWQAEVRGERFTGDPAADHGYSFREACATLGIPARPHCDTLLWR